MDILADNYDSEYERIQAELDDIYDRTDKLWVTFENKLIMDMPDDKAVTEGFHGVAGDVVSDSTVWMRWKG